MPPRSRLPVSEPPQAPCSCSAVKSPGTRRAGCAALAQARYLVSGARASLSYAEYARHGFFELVVVSLLVLPVVLAANALARDRLRLVRLLSAALVVLELAVAASALERLRLYQRQFGLTELRVYATGIVVWLACVFVWLCATPLLG